MAQTQFGYLDADITFLKDMSKQVFCRKLVGYDANALYLHCFGREMPTWFYIDYILTTAGWFRRSFPRNQNVGVHEWFTHITTSWRIYIQHASNNTEKVWGMQKRHVDGWCEDTQTAFEYDSCYCHRHDCISNWANLTPAAEVMWNKQRRSTHIFVICWV